MNTQSFSTVDNLDFEKLSTMYDSLRVMRKIMLDVTAKEFTKECDRHSYEYVTSKYDKPDNTKRVYLLPQNEIIYLVLRGYGLHHCMYGYLPIFVRSKEDIIDECFKQSVGRNYKICIKI